MVNPKLRFKRPDGTAYPDWERKKIGDMFFRVNERNDGSFDKTDWISVAKMYYQEPDKVTSNNIDTRTYVMRYGDMAFEGHPNDEFQYGRFVVNDIGDGVISELFPIYRHKSEYVLKYWKYAIQIERIMALIYRKAITSSGASSNKLNEEDFLNESLRVPSQDEQKRIAGFFTAIDDRIDAQEQYVATLETQKKELLSQVFAREIRFKDENGQYYPDWIVTSFDELAEYKKGPFGSALKKEIFVPKSNDTVKVYEQQNAIEKDWKLSRYYISDEYFKKMKAFFVSGGDILVSCAGTIGEMYILPDEAESGVINQALMRVRVNEGRVLKSIFICLFDKMLSDEGKRLSNGSALKNIPPFADLKAQEVTIPSLSEQQRIADFFTVLDAQIENERALLEDWRQLKKGLLQQMFV